jgi:hypothetical protein
VEQVELSIGKHWTEKPYQVPKLDWVVAGGESQHGSRPSHPDWFRTLRDQCAAADVPFLFKQWGDWTPGENVQRTKGKVRTASLFNEKWDYGTANLAKTDGHIDDEPDVYHIGKGKAGRLLDGVEHNGFPAKATAWQARQVPASGLPLKDGTQ